MRSPFPDLPSDRPSREPSFSVSTAQLGMILFLASLAVLFVATLIAYWITRWNHPDWRGVLLGLPWGLHTSTVMIGGVSLSMELAKRGLARNRQLALQRHLWSAAGFAVAFVAAQVLNWRHVLELNSGESSRQLSMFTFYMLTGVHALHVVGGLVPLVWVMYRARQREYSSSRAEGVRLCAQYWHFLGVVWLILLAVMFWN